MTATIIERTRPVGRLICGNSRVPVELCRRPCHWCDMSDLHVYECALPCHRNDRLPAGLDPEEQPVRGVIPSGVAVWPLPIDKARLEQVSLVVQVDRLGRRTLTPLARHHRSIPKRTGKCRYFPELETWCTPEHGRDCRSSLCLGCKPCGKDHCELRGTCPNHVDHALDLWTCPQCIGTVRTHLAEIVDLTILVSAELEYSGIESEALNLAGPAAAPEQLDARRTQVITRDDGRGWCDYPMRPEVYAALDRYHPYAVLARWENHFRDVYQVPNTTSDVTITSAAAYLTKLLSTKVPHREGFEAFARDVARCCTHLEEVLSDSRRPETGAPCPKCSDALAGTDRRAPRLTKRHDQGDRSGANDLWICPEVPTHRWKEADYRIRVAGDFLARADRLTADQLRQQYGITPGNLRRWANGWTTDSGKAIEPQVRKRGRDSNGRLTYDVQDARLCEDRRRGWCDYPRHTDVYPIESEQATA